jgi:hypothetical protein
MERGAAHLARACAKRSKSALSPYIAGVSGRFKYLDFCHIINKRRIHNVDQND